MKTFKVGIVAVAILLVVTGVGIGIARAAGSNSERPVLSFEDQEASQDAISSTENMQLQNPTETGNLPSESDADSPIIEISGMKYRVGVDTGP